MLMLLMIVVMAAAVLIMVMVMMFMLILAILIVMVVVMLVLVLPVIIVVVVMFVLLVLIMIVMMVFVFVLIVVIIVMVVTAAVVIVLLFFQALLFQSGQLGSQGSLAFHGLDQLRAGEVIPGSGDDGSHLVVLPEHLHSGVQLELIDGIGTGQDDGGGGFDLVVVELAEVLHIHLHLACVHHGHGVAQGHFVARNLVHGADDIGQLAHTGGLDDDAVGMVLGDHLFQSLAEVTHQGAADAAGIHFGDVDARILQEAAVNADLTELILDEHQLLSLVALGNQLLDQGGLAGSQEAGINIYFGHKKAPSLKNSLPVIIPPSVNHYQKFFRAICD